jgi:hypothetical protein
MRCCLCGRLVGTEEACQEGARFTVMVSNHFEGFEHCFYGYIYSYLVIISDLCTRFKKIFTHEHTLFTPSQLTKHYKFGDKSFNKDDESGFTGHPDCAFCKNSFYGDDELFEHCRDKHEQCHICVRQNIRHQYYRNYDELVRFFTF